MEKDPERLPAIVDYLRMNPTPPPGGDGSTGQHIHIHHHYAPPAPPTPPPKQTVAEQVVPWMYFGLMACIIMTVCAVLLAAVIVALVVGLLAVAVVAAVIAYLIKTTRESQINADLAGAAAQKVRRTR